MIQVKQLKRLKYESFDYGKYEKLRKIFLDPEFEPEDVEELDLSNEKAVKIPNKQLVNKIQYFRHCLQLLINLTALVLSHNQIHRFNGLELAKSCPQLQVLDLSFNLIEELDDIIDMGILEDLRILDISGNYVCTYVARVNMIENILCPKKYVKYNPVRILTAGYNQIPVSRLTDQAYEQQKQDRRVIERLPEELRPDEMINTVSKYNHKNTLGKYSLEPCPIPRKTRFKRLEYLNGNFITKLEIMRVTGLKHFKLALEDIHDVKRQKELQNQKNEKKTFKKNQKLHEQYIKKYLKRINRQIMEGNDGQGQKRQAPAGDSPSQDLLLQLTQADMQSASKRRLPINAKQFAAELWETPMDVIFKDAEFSIGIEDFKKEQREFEKKKKLKDEKLNNNRNRKYKYKMSISKQDDRSYRSSDSSLNENQSSQTKSLNSFQDDDDSLQSETSLTRKPTFDHSSASALELRTKLTAQKKQLSEEKKKSAPPTAPPKQHSYQQSTAIQQHGTEQKTSVASISPSPQPPPKSVSPPRQDAAEGGQETLRQEQLVKLYPSGPSAIYSYHQSQDGITLQVQQFRMGEQPIPAQQLVAAQIREETKNSFQIKNKLHSKKQIVTQKEFNEDKEKHIIQLKKAAQREREEIEELHPPEQVVAAPPKTFEDDEGNVVEQKNVKNFWREMERVKVHGDLNKTDYQKIKIPLESLVPTVEQGIPEHLRVNFLFDANNEKYKELVHYKKILEDSKNLRQACDEMDRKIEIQGIRKHESKFKASDFNTVFNFLKEDPKFEIQNSYDPANAVMRKKGKLQNSKKVSTFEMREIIYGANEYDPQQEPKIVEKDILYQLDHEKGITMEERKKLYEWLEVLDNIKLKSTKTDEKRLKRIEKKEIERAQSFAHLAYHYQKLKKYVPEDKLQKYVKLMGIPLDEIISENKQSNIPKAKERAGTSQGIARSHQVQGIKSRSTTQIKKAANKEPDLTKQINKLLDEKAETIEQEQAINKKRIENLKKEMLSDNGYMAENHPNIVEFLKEKEKIKQNLIKPQLTFEEMMDQNLRRLQDQFQKKGGSTALTLEEQMMRYAQEFNEKVKNRERLKANIKQYINETSKKLDEFWAWEANERENRNDKTACFKRYVKLVREGQIKII